MKSALSLAAFAGLLCLPMALAQTGKIDLYTAQQLTHAAPANSAVPGPGTLTQGVLKHYPNHFTMLITRTEDGQSELHEHLADVFFVVDGEAELLTGGSMVAAKDTEPGEKRGSGLSGASSMPLRKGDVVHIPAATPHQLRIPAHGRFTYFVVKVDEISTGSGAGH